MEKTKLLQLLGENISCQDLAGTLLSREEHQGFYLESLVLSLNLIEKVPAYFAYPKTQGPHPLVLFSHSHGGNFSHGKEELVVSSVYLQPTPMIEEFIKLGFAVGCIDQWGFGERSGKKESQLVKEALLYGYTLWGLRLFDSQRFLEYLLHRNEVDTQMVVTLGMSMGGMLSWWLAALNPKITTVVDLCGQVHLETLVKKGGLDHHGYYYYIPGLLKETSTLAIQQLIAPRARLSLTGRADTLCPLEGVAYLNRELAKTYHENFASKNWQSQVVSGGHQETKEMRAKWKIFLNEQKRKHL
jgi:dienelactone hydrolase